MDKSVCHYCGLFSLEGSLFCQRCGARLHWEPADVLVHQFDVLNQMIAGSSWRYVDCQRYFKAQTSFILNRLGGGVVFNGLQASMILLARNLKQVGSQSNLIAGLKILEIHKELITTILSRTDPLTNDLFDKVKSNQQKNRRLYQSLRDLDESLNGRVVSPRKLAKRISKISEENHPLECSLQAYISRSPMQWPSLAISFECCSLEEVKNLDAVEKSLNQYRKKNFGTCRSILKEVLESDPKHVHALELAARLASREENFTQAVQLYRQAIHAGSENPLTYNNCAWYLLQTEDNSNAKEALNYAAYAVKVLPSATCFDTLAAVYEQLSQNEMAIYASRLGLEIESDKQALLDRMRRICSGTDQRNLSNEISSESEEDFEGQVIEVYDSESFEAELFEDDEGADLMICPSDDDELEFFGEEIGEGFASPSPAELNETPAMFSENEVQEKLLSCTSRGEYEEASLTQKDSVDCTVYAPPHALVGDVILVQVFAHLPEDAAIVKANAQTFDEDATERGATSLGTLIERGTELDFELRMKHVEIDPPRQKFVWQGRPGSIQFEVFVPEGTKRRTTIGTVIISQNSVPIGTIKFKLKLVAEIETVRDDVPTATGDAQRFKKAFVSYASEDRDEVLRRVQMLNSVGIQYFQDLLDLDAGQRWERQLYKHIDESDVLFLFWSTEAKKSPWVAKEWQYGIERKGLDFVQPVIIEGPPVVPPPEELAELHFNDRILYFLQ